MTDTARDAETTSSMSLRTLRALRRHPDGVADDAPPAEVDASTSPESNSSGPAATKAAVSGKPSVRSKPDATKSATNPGGKSVTTKTATAKTTTAKTATAKKATTKPVAATAAKAISAAPATRKPVAAKVVAKKPEKVTVPPSRLTVALAIVAVAALAFVAVAAVTWWRAGHNATRTAAVQRDQVVLAARLDAAALNTLDYQHADAALTKWLSVSTGSVHDQFTASRATAAKLIAQAKTSTSAVVLDAATSELDVKHGTASVLMSMNVKKTPAKGSATTSRNRYVVSMKRVGDQWKISDLKTVEVTLS